VIAPDLQVLFCGINPSVKSAEVGHHFAGRGNRFWQALYQSGFTDRLLLPSEDRLLLEYGCGSTNLVRRATNQGKEVDGELKAGVVGLRRKVRRYQPGFVAFLGIEAYRKAFDRKDAVIGRQADHSIAGAAVWLLPNPSARVAHYQPAKLAELFGELRVAVVSGVTQSGHARAR
jgi:TDG/mug DNA glycosylase family protein